MSRINDILLRVRDTLGDHGKNRWSDEDLLRRLQDALTDISVHTKYYTKTTSLALEVGKSIYTLPSDVYHLKAVLFDSRNIPIISISEAEHLYGADWRTDISHKQIKHIIKEHLNTNKFQVYPRPFMSYLDTVVEAQSPYGFLGDLSGYTTDSLVSSPFGVIDTIIDEDSLYYTPDAFGLLGTMTTTGAMSVTYAAKAELPTTTDSDLDIVPIFDNALKYYICGMALRHDIDQQNRQMGAEELQFYNRELQAIDVLARSNGSPIDSHRTIYNGIG